MAAHATIYEYEAEKKNTAAVNNLNENAKLKKSNQLNE